MGEVSRLISISLAVVEFSIEELVEEAEAIVVATVSKHLGTGLGEPSWLEGLALPYEEYQLEVQEPIKSSDSYDSPARLRTLGGVSGAFSARVEDEASVSPGEEAVLFLSKDTLNIFELPKNTYTVLGFSQGHYPVISIDGNRYVAPEGMPESAPRPVDAFVDEVWSILKHA
jgi:hypothetical protein